MNKAIAFRTYATQKRNPLALSEVAIRRAGATSKQAHPLRRVAQSDPGAGNVYEAGGVQLQFRALLRGRIISKDGISIDEAKQSSWSVAVREPATASSPEFQGISSWRAARMRHGSDPPDNSRSASNNVWRLDFSDPSLPSFDIDLRGNDPMALAAYDAHLPFEEDNRLDSAGPRCTGNTEIDGITQLSRVKAEFPFWPDEIHKELARCGLKGAGAVVFHADTFLEMLYTSAFPGPVLFPHAAYRLQTRVGSVMAAMSQLLSPSGVKHYEGPGSSSGEALIGALGEDGLSQLSGGRLTALLEKEEGLCQIGEGLLDGLGEARAEPVEVEFQGPPMGIGLGPASDDEIGMVVTEVDEGSAADVAGVLEGWAVTRINEEDVSEVPFWDADARFDEPPPWRVRFDPDLGASNFYVVELPAAELIEQLRDATGADIGGDAEAGHDLQARCTEATGGLPPFVWQEGFARLFLGDPGSMTCLHVDLLPQLEFCHMLAGAKVLGACSWSETPALLERFGGSAGPTGASKAAGSGKEADKEETHPAILPCDKPLLPREQELLTEASVSLVFAQPGDVVVFSSAAAHFATNGAEQPSAALYHGALNPASVRRLCEDVSASRDPFTEEERAGEYSNHLTALELVREYSLGSAPSSGITQASELQAKMKSASKSGCHPGSSLWPSRTPTGIKDGDSKPDEGLMRTTWESDIFMERYAECLGSMEAAMAAAHRGQGLPDWPGEESPGANL